MAAKEGALGRVSLQMASTLELGEVLAEITRGLVDELEASLARIWLLGRGDACDTCPLGAACEHREECLHLVASAGLSSRLDGAYRRVPIGVRKIGRIGAAREPLYTSDLEGDPRIADKPWVREHGLVAFAGYPLVFRGELLGVLAVFTKRALTPAELERLGVFAAYSAVAIKNAQLFEEVSQLSKRLEAENAYLKEELAGHQASGIVGKSGSLARALGALERVAPTASTVLLLGETGTGKELFARALHDLSPRRTRPLIKVNCAAISPTLIESELFGHEKGAFTGALQRRIGRFELAHGGTLFLDEVGELPLEAQAKLLRVLQEREVERIGGTQPIRVDVRIVCATNRNLTADVRAQRFRSDLYYRLNVFPIEIPPLRERREDIPLLADAFLRTLGHRLGRTFTGIDDDALRLLVEHDWPGNVRELQNVLERAAILATGTVLHADDLPDFAPFNAPAVSAHEVSGPSPSKAQEPEDVAPSGGDGEDVSLRTRVDAYERTLIAEALRRAGGNQSEAARRLGTSRATLLYKLKAYGL